MLKEILVVFISSVFLFSCSSVYQPIQSTPSNILIPDRKTFETIGPTEGISCQSLFGWIRIEGKGTDVQLAIDDALEKVDADALINMTIDYERLVVFFVISKQCTKVKGTAIKFK